MPTAGRRDRGMQSRKIAAVRTPLVQSRLLALLGAGPTVGVTGTTFYGANLAVTTAVGVLGVALFAYTINGIPGVGGTTTANFNVPELPGVSLQFSAGTYAVNILTGVV